MSTQQKDLIVSVLAKGDERYAVAFYEGQVAAVVQKLLSWVRNPELSFDAWDAMKIFNDIRRQLYG